MMAPPAEESLTTISGRDRGPATIRPPSERASEAS